MSVYPGVISYPISAYQNPPIEPQFYQPSRFNIAAISLGSTTTVTTSVDNNYVVGQLVRFIIPQNFGTYQLNERKGYVLSLISSTQVLVDLNSIFMDPFIASPIFPVGQSKTVAQILAIGDINTGTTNATGRTNQSTFIPGSFIDISPL